MKLCRPRSCPSFVCVHFLLGVVFCLEGEVILSRTNHQLHSVISVCEKVSNPRNMLMFLKAFYNNLHSCVDILSAVVPINFSFCSILTSHNMRCRMKTGLAWGRLNLDKHCSQRFRRCHNWIFKTTRRITVPVHLVFFTLVSLVVSGCKACFVKVHRGLLWRLHPVTDFWLAAIKIK